MNPNLPKYGGCASLPPMQREPSKQVVIEAIETATQAEPGSCAESAKLSVLDGWDSLGIVGFIEEIRKNCDVELPVDDVLACATVQELVETVMRR